MARAKYLRCVPRRPLPRPAQLLPPLTRLGRRWTPAAIPSSTMLVWLKAGSTWCFTDAGKTDPCDFTELVYTWADRSGNARDFTQATPGSRPTLASLSGTPVVRGDGVDDWINCLTVPNLLNGTGWEIYVTLRSAVFNGARFVGSTSTDKTLFNSADGSLASFQGPTVTGFTTGSRYLAEWRQLTTGNASLRINADAAQTAAASNDLTGGLSLFRRQAEALFAQADIHEFVVVTGALAAGVRSSLRAYMAAEFGVAA